jgi:hypothetical protein
MVAATYAATVGESRTELAEVLNRDGDAYLRQHYLRPAQLKAMQAIRSCRKAARGGQCQWCSRCGFVRYAYHSCHNRYCPKCQTFAKEQWLQLRRRELLPVLSIVAYSFRTDTSSPRSIKRSSFSGHFRPDSLRFRRGCFRQRVNGALADASRNVSEIPPGGPPVSSRPFLYGSFFRVWST